MGALNKIGAFGRGMWRYWRHGQPQPESNDVVQKLYAYTDGRSNDILFRILESRRREPELNSGWNGTSLISDAGIFDPSIESVVRTLREDGVVVVPLSLKKEVIDDLRHMASSCRMRAMTYGGLGADQVPGSVMEVPIRATGESEGIDPSSPCYSTYVIPRELLLSNINIQKLLCDSYLLAVATRYLGVFPVVTKPDMWWDTEFVPPGLRPRPFHTDSGCLRWFKVGINLTDTTLESPHFVYVKGSHKPNPVTRTLTNRLTNRMNLSDKEVTDVCADKIVHITGPAGSITLADTRGIHKGEISLQGNRLILYFGLEGSAFNNIDKPISLDRVGADLQNAMKSRPFGYQFFRTIH